MNAGRAISIFIFTLLLIGCSDPRGRAMKTMQQFKAEQLRKDCAVFYKNIFAEHRQTSAVVNQQYWSYSFQQLAPKRITAYADGFALCLEAKGDSESGLYVIPLGMEVEPKPTAWASYEKISDGIFWYSFKP